jgi:mono/diheme cytochrome c family protein
MLKIYTVILVFFILLAGCKETTKNKSGSTEILTEGAELFAKYGCAVCHSLKGDVIYGPPLNGIYMKKIRVIRDGKEVEIVADRNYLKKSISDPRYEKVLEYNNKEMPISNFSDEEAEILVDYLIALDEKNKPEND